VEAVGKEGAREKAGGEALITRKGGRCFENCIFVKLQGLKL
jgi:hypothetical protein